MAFDQLVLTQLYFRQQLLVPLCATKFNGKLNGVIAPITPIGFRIVYAIRPSAPGARLMAMSHHIYASLLQLQICTFEQYDLLLPLQHVLVLQLLCNNLCKFFSSFIHFCATFSKIVARSYADNVFIFSLHFCRTQPLDIFFRSLCNFR